MKINIRTIAGILSFSLFLIICCHLSPVLADQIINNGDPGTAFSGTWSISGGSNPWDPADIDAVSLWSRNGTTYTWTFTAADTGDHDVAMWWTEWPSRGERIPVTIEHAGGTDNVFINQQLNGGRWNSLGSFAFVAGVSYAITITSLPGPSSTCADAVRFLYSGGGSNIPPNAVIDSIDPNPALPDQPISFAGYGDDPDGSISGYNWSSDLDGTLSDLASFTTTSPLSLGNHTISFTVYDNEGQASEAATQQLVVQGAITEFIIDNGDPDTRSTGTWSISGGTNPWDPAEPGAVSLYGKSGATYTWTFTPPLSGRYDFSMWWTEWPSRNGNIPLTIQHADGTDSLTINQQINGGKWNGLGNYNFLAGVSYDVTITAPSAPSSTCADTIRFEYTGGSLNLLPAARIDVINPSALLPGDEITFMGSGSDSDGSVTAYAWESDIDGVLSDLESFSTTSLSPGLHTIFFRVRDNQDAWSTDATALVVVRDCETPVAIMPLGDSITYGISEITDPNLLTGYRAPLHDQLVGDGYYVDFVGNQAHGQLVAPPYDIHHQGIPGLRSNEVVASVYNWLTESQAEIILLHIGTNGLITSAVEVMNILDEIDRYERDTGIPVVVVLARIINRDPFHPDTTVFNNNVQAMAEGRIAAGDKIVIVDQESVLNYTTDMSDPYHPNSQGYAKMAGPWMDELLGLLPICGILKPFIFTTPIESTTIGSAYTYQVAALGNPAVNYSLLSAPIGMTINETSGEVDWTPSTGQEGSHLVSLQAISAAGVDTQSFNINVTRETIIIDNGDPETASTGTWSESGGPNPWDPADLLARSVYSRDGSTYTWTFTPPTSGTYQVDMWWTEYPSTYHH